MVDTIIGSDVLKHAHEDAVARGDLQWEKALAFTTAGFLEGFREGNSLKASAVLATLGTKANHPTIEGSWCRSILGAMKATGRIG
jgi:hypothetical protein